MQVRANANLLLPSSAAVLLLPLLVLSGCGGGKAQAVVTQPTTVTLPVVSLSVSPAAVLPGQSATLTWSTSSAATCTSDGAWSGSQQMNGALNVTLPSATGQTYSLECTSASGQSVRSSVTLALSPTDGACTTSHAVAATGKRIGKRRALNGAHS